MEEDVYKSREEICKIAFTESQRGLAIQDSTLGSIRQSAAVLGTLSGLAATFLGKEALSKQAATICVINTLDTAIWIAIAALIAALVLVGLLLLPRNVWKFHFSAESIIKQFVQPNITLADTYDALSKFNEVNYADNNRTLNKMFILLYLLMIALSIQIGAWLFAFSLFS